MTIMRRRSRDGRSKMSDCEDDAWKNCQKARSRPFGYLGKDEGQTAAKKEAAKMGKLR